MVSTERGWALEFTASESNYVDCGTGINPAKAVTVSLWIKVKTLGRWHGIFNENGFNFCGRVADNYTVYMSVKDVNGNQVLNYWGDVSDKKWHHYAFTVSVSTDTAVFYWDGDKIGSKSCGLREI